MKLSKNAVSDKFPHTPKQTLKVLLDTEVLAWLKKDGRGYQKRANQMLRERMLEDLKRT